MKNYLRNAALLFFTIICATASAQDTLNTTEVQDTFAPPQYQVVYDEPSPVTNRLFKVGVDIDRNALGGAFLGILPSLAYEQRISKNLTLNAALTYDRRLGWEVQPRVYLNTRIDPNDATAALNGLYLSATYKKPPTQGRYTIDAGIGYQKRFLKRWYFDYTFNFTVFQRRSESDFPPIKSLFKLGYAFGRGGRNEEDKCTVFRCFEEEKSLFKIDLSGLVTSFQSNSTYSYGSTSLGVEYERKIKNSAFSINSGVVIGYQKFTSKRDSTFNSNSVGASVSIEPRFYFNLKNRIAKGKSANNLSGSYVSLRTDASFSTYNLDRAATTEKYSSIITGGFSPRLGIQKRIFKRGFVDMSFAPFSYNFDIYKNRNFEYVRPNFQLNPIFEDFDKNPIRRPRLLVDILQIKAGFAF